MPFIWFFMFFYRKLFSPIYLLWQFIRSVPVAEDLELLWLDWFSPSEDLYWDRPPLSHLATPLYEIHSMRIISKLLHNCNLPFASNIRFYLFQSPWVLYALWYFILLLYIIVYSAPTFSSLEKYFSWKEKRNNFHFILPEITFL